MTVGRIPVIEGGIQPTIFDAKGDLLTATANDTPARLAVGINGETLIADSTASTGLKWAKSANFVGCAVYQTAGATSIANATVTALAYDAEFFDTNGFHDNSTNNSRITIPAGLGGYYLVSTATRFSTNGTGTRTGKIYLNGTDIGDQSDYAGSSVSFVIGSGTWILNLSAGDYLQHVVYQASGGSLNVFARNVERPFTVQFLGA